MLYDGFIDDILEGITDRLGVELGDYLSEVQEAIRVYLLASREDLERWTKLYAAGAMTSVDYQWLVKAHADAAELHGIKHLGLALVGVDRIRAAIAGSIMDAALGLVGL